MVAPKTVHQQVLCGVQQNPILIQLHQSPTIGDIAWIHVLLIVIKQGTSMHILGLFYFKIQNSIWNHSIDTNWVFFFIAVLNQLLEVYYRE